MGFYAMTFIDYVYFFLFFFLVWVDVDAVSMGGGIF